MHSVIGKMSKRPVEMLGGCSFGDTALLLLNPIFLRMVILRKNGMLEMRKTSPEIWKGCAAISDIIYSEEHVLIQTENRQVSWKFQSNFIVPRYLSVF